MVIEMGSRVIRVHDEFARSLEKEKEMLEKETGMKLSMQEFTKMMAKSMPVEKGIRPSNIFVKKNKKKRYIIGFDI